MRYYLISYCFTVGVQVGVSAFLLKKEDDCRPHILSALSCVKKRGGFRGIIPINTQEIDESEAKLYEEEGVDVICFQLPRS